MTTKRETRSDAGTRRGPKKDLEPKRLYVVQWGTNLRYVVERSPEAARRYWRARQRPILDLFRLTTDEVRVRPATADEVNDWNEAHVHKVDRW